MFFEKLILLIPSICILCGSHSGEQNICTFCQQNLPILSHHCPRCAQILPPGLPCPSCLKEAPVFDHTFAIFPYQPPVIRLITSLKFKHDLSVAKLLGDLFVSKIVSEWYINQPYPKLIIPVPLHIRRLRERGFNQSLEIARPISRALNIPLDIYGTKRIKDTKAQSGLTAADRKKNMDDAFSVQRDYSGLFIAVIDDVITTKHTVTALCKVLKQAGAEKIDVWCCARAMAD